MFITRGEKNLFVSAEMPFVIVAGSREESMVETASGIRFWALA
jgi:hypothetical protein